MRTVLELQRGARVGLKAELLARPHGRQPHRPPARPLGRPRRPVCRVRPSTGAAPALGGQHVLARRISGTCRRRGRYPLCHAARAGSYRRDATPTGRCRLPGPRTHLHPSCRRLPPASPVPGRRRGLPSAGIGTRRPASSRTWSGRNAARTASSLKVPQASGPAASRCGGAPPPRERTARFEPARGGQPLDGVLDPRQLPSEGRRQVARITLARASAPRPGGGLVQRVGQRLQPLAPGRGPAARLQFRLETGGSTRRPAACCCARAARSQPSRRASSAAATAPATPCACGGGCARAGAVVEADAEDAGISRSLAVRASRRRCHADAARTSAASGSTADACSPAALCGRPPAPVSRPARAGTTRAARPRPAARDAVAPADLPEPPDLLVDPLAPGVRGEQTTIRNATAPARPRSRGTGRPTRAVLVVAEDPPDARRQPALPHQRRGTRYVSSARCSHCAQARSRARGGN
jgi:hypothetical protein